MKRFLYLRFPVHLCGAPLFGRKRRILYTDDYDCFDREIPYGTGHFEAGSGKNEQHDNERGMG